MQTCVNRVLFCRITFLLCSQILSWHGKTSCQKNTLALTSQIHPYLERLQIIPSVLAAKKGAVVAVVVPLRPNVERKTVSFAFDIRLSKSQFALTFAILLQIW